MDFVNWEFAKDYIRNSLRISLGIFWTKIGLDFNFAPIYNKMEKFNDSNALPKKMDFYTSEEFQKFMSVIDDIKFKALFETLYFCGLRRSELSGLYWDNIKLKIKLYRVKNISL